MLAATSLCYLVARVIRGGLVQFGSAGSGKDLIAADLRCHSPMNDILTDAQTPVARFHGLATNA